MHLLNEWMSQIDMFIPKLRQSLKMHYDNNNNNTSNDNVMTTIPPSQTLKVSAIVWDVGVPWHVLWLRLFRWLTMQNQGMQTEQCFH